MRIGRPPMRARVLCDIPRRAAALVLSCIVPCIDMTDTSSAVALWSQENGKRRASAFSVAWRTRTHAESVLRSRAISAGPACGRGCVAVAAMLVVTLASAATAPVVSCGRSSHGWLHGRADRVHICVSYAAVLLGCTDCAVIIACAGCWSALTCANRLHPDRARPTRVVTCVTN